MNTFRTTFLVVVFCGLCSLAFQPSKDVKGDNESDKTPLDTKEILRNSRSKSRVVEIKAVDMSKAMQRRTLQFTREAFEEYSSVKDIADHIKDELDDTYGGRYHCIVGTSFGFSIIYALRYYFHFKLNGYTILVFRH
ncbi:dynein light chain 1, cytoplasmic-like [Mytilus californianus]|uniref:dynein light chain 1, cytoplasmic-like n=1 Tax=Mytilus californianus TaxID=6549 RepID=UPI0022459035|nr:dynein light chain 1, cytoplasmic-like [Mytilus californianus]